MDIGNAYLNAKFREKMWCEAGPEFEGDRGSVMIIVRDLYGLKSSGGACREMLDRVIENMGFKSCSQADAHVYMTK